MKDFLIDREVTYLNEVRRREFVFEDGEKRHLYLYRIYWVWYDRFCAADATFAARLKANLREEAARYGHSVSNALKRVLEDLVNLKLERGDDPCETKSERAERVFETWCLRKASRP